jgi:hypothetical protein
MRSHQGQPPFRQHVIGGQCLGSGLSGYGTWAVAWHWNGHSWKQVMTPQLGPVNSLQDVAVIPRSGGAWAVGSTNHGTLMLHWNGTAWH